MRMCLFPEHRGAPGRAGLQSIRIRVLRLVGLLSLCRGGIIRFTSQIIREVAFDELVEETRPAYVVMKLTSA